MKDFEMKIQGKDVPVLSSNNVSYYPVDLLDFVERYCKEDSDTDEFDIYFKTEEEFNKAKEIFACCG